MRLNNIFLTLTLIAGMMFSCVSEDIVGPYNNGGDDDVIDGLPTTLSIKLSPGKIATKAIGEAPLYDYASPDELFVGEAAVAIFNVENGVPTTLKAYKHITNPAKTSTTTDTLAWEITGIDVTTGLSHILVVANLPESKLSKLVEGVETTDPITYPSADGTSYSEFKKLIATESFDNTFDPKSLVKVGELQTTLSTDNKVIEIPMVQLAAKVSLTIKVDIEPQKETGSVQYPPTTDNIIRQILDREPYDTQGYSKRALFPLTAQLQPGQTQYYGYNCKWGKDDVSPDVHGTSHNTGWWKDTEYILWNGVPKAVSGLTSPSNKVIEIGIEKAGTGDSGSIGFAIDSIFSTTYWNLHINSVTVNHIQTKTDVIIEGFNTQKSVIGEWFSSPNADVQDQYQVSFYTYEMAKFTNDDDLMTITIDCKLNKQTVSITKHYKGAESMHIVAVNSNGGITSWGSQSNYAAILISGFDEELTETDEPSEPKIEGSIYNRTFQVKVNDEGALVHGHWYGLTTTMTTAHLPTRAAAADFDPANIGILINRTSMPWTR